MRQGGSLGAQHGIVAMHGARLSGGGARGGGDTDRNGGRRRVIQASSSGSNGGGDRDRCVRDHGRDMAGGKPLSLRPPGQTGSTG